jgi:hypothetical protein
MLKLGTVSGSIVTINLLTGPSHRRHNEIMNKQTRAKVLATALAVREWALEETTDSMLTGWCAKCSAELWKRLSAIGIRADIVMCEQDSFGHVFLNVEGWIVDPTATQFGLLGKGGVTIMHEKESEAFDFYEPCQIFGEPKELVKYQKRVGWPKSQTARI